MASSKSSEPISKQSETPGQRGGTLTERELEIMGLIAQGLDSRAIARRLHISQRTERNHVASILAKLGVHSRLQALVFCLRGRVVELA